MVTKVQKAQRLPYRMNPKRNMLRHIVIKLTEIKILARAIREEKEKESKLEMKN